MTDFTRPELKELMREVARETAKETLRGLGADVDHPLEMQHDFARLRSWRQAMDAIQKKVYLTLVGILITGLAAAIYISFKK